MIKYPARPFGIDRKYDLPKPEPRLEPQLVKRWKPGKAFGDRKFVERTYREVKKRNPELPEASSTENKYHAVMGATSRIPLADIRFFIDIGGGSNQTVYERQNRIDLMNAIGKRAQWVLSPTTKLRLAGKAGPLSCVKISFQVLHAQVERKLGIEREEPDLYY